QHMFELIKNIRDTVTSSQVIVTVASVIQTSAYEELFNKENSFARTIPTTPSSLGNGATGIFFNKVIAAYKKELVID
ncbi:pyrroline-5-carboxylate reductase, partial [Francisella tularensis subsp. holarctica]|uniref:pyrroline-5-carboxylate reductase family protein n=1 Tax=Francisella tularensis TaxID=263 RepID=UPI0023AE05DA|nr:pyrroline-5-carboxylate reductase [Francisella tularensis subsp. holarctica]